MTVRKAPSYSGFRTIALQVLALLAGVRAVIIVVFLPLQAPPGVTGLLAVTGLALLGMLIAVRRRGRVSERAGRVILWLALASALLRAIALEPAQLGDLSCFTILPLVVVAAAVLEIRGTIIFAVVATLSGTVGIVLGSDLPLPTTIAFVGMTSTTCVVVSMLRGFLRIERDHAIGLSLTDALTGAANRRGMAERVPALSDLAQRTGQRLGCMVLDIDNFKTINDIFGHPQGDLVLVDLASAVATMTRRSDVLVRLGGEEFALFVVVATVEELRELAEELRVAVTAGASSPAVTVSIGATLGSGGTEQDIAALLGTADAAMYLAKKSGRDRVVVV